MECERLIPLNFPQPAGSSASVVLEVMDNPVAWLAGKGGRRGRLREVAPVEVEQRQPMENVLRNEATKAHGAEFR
jgi:hypothetical protein